MLKILYKRLVENAEIKKSLGIPRRGRESSIEI
jgi:hypothetical protein